MRILITGASGFIGLHILAKAAAIGHDVLALSRSPKTQMNLGHWFEWSFGKHLPEDAKHKVDCVIHLAHDFRGEEGSRRTIDSTLALIEEFRTAGVHRQIFFSSYSSGMHASSIYGRTKLEIEQRVADSKDIVIVRPGLVLGDGGIYGRIKKWAQILPIVPLPDGGIGEVPVIGIERLCSETIEIAFSSHALKEANLFEKKLKSLRSLVLDAANEVDKHPWILPIPARILIAALRVASKLRIPLPINVDNISGFIANQSAQHESTLRE